METPELVLEVCATRDPLFGVWAFLMSLALLLIAAAASSLFDAFDLPDNLEDDDGGTGDQSR